MSDLDIVQSLKSEYKEFCSYYEKFNISEIACLFLAKQYRKQYEFLTPSLLETWFKENEIPKMFCSEIVDKKEIRKWLIKDKGFDYGVDCGFLQGFFFAEIIHMFFKTTLFGKIIPLVLNNVQGHVYEHCENEGIPDRSELYDIVENFLSKKYDKIRQSGNNPLLQVLLPSGWKDDTPFAFILLGQGFDLSLLRYVPESIKSYIIEYVIYLYEQKVNFSPIHRMAAMERKSKSLF